MDPVKELAKMIDHSLLPPVLTDQDLIDGCKLAIEYDVASVCIKPYAVKLAAEQLVGSDVLVGTVIGFPQGNSSIDVKVYETVQACKDGAVEIDMVVNIGKVLSEDWDYLTKEIGAVLNACHDHNAILKVIFENDYLPEDKYKIKLCEICSGLNVEYVKTSSGFGFKKVASGGYGYDGATEYDVKLMRQHVAPHVKVKAAGGIRTLDKALLMKSLGVSRIGASATKTILEDAKKHFSS